MKRLLFIVIAGGLLAGCGSMSTGAAAPIAEAARAQTAPPALEFVRMAGASDLYEIQSSQLVLETTQDARLRQFAAMMVEHHTMTTNAVMRAASADGLAPPPPALDARRMEMIRQLQARAGMARDDHYKQQQVMAHREALELHGSYASSGDSAALRGAAAAAVPVVSRHYNMIVGMADAGGSTSGN